MKHKIIITVAALTALSCVALSNVQPAQAGVADGLVRMGTKGIMNSSEANDSSGAGWLFVGAGFLVGVIGVAVKAKR